uniref:hypothetical protein n=1 Tax=Caballeronia arationis TaxID=1777142 RepID=UPI0035B538DB
MASLDREVETAAHASAVWPVIEALMALRGIGLLAAVRWSRNSAISHGFPARRN